MCQDDMCRVHISDKNEVEWYSQKQQKKHELYNTTKVFIKKIVTLEQIDVEEIDIHDIQKENFLKYNKEVYISENDKIFRQKENWKKAVKQIEIIVKEIINTVWKSQKSELSTELYNFRWTLAEDDTQDIILWKEKLWVIKLWKMVQKIHQKKRKMSQIDI